MRRNALSSPVGQRRFLISSEVMLTSFTGRDDADLCLAISEDLRRNRFPHGQRHIQPFGKSLVRHFNGARHRRWNRLAIQK